MQYFWCQTTPIISVDMNSPEAFNWKTALALLEAWVLVYMCMIKESASSGKVSSYELRLIYTMCSASNIVPRLKNYKLITHTNLLDGNFYQ
jgi:solute carrier family 6 amino acid/orphan transporter-like 15/16/17/18/20